MKSKFYEDKRLEELFGEWLDTHFYATGAISHITKIQRINDAEYQKKGVDVVLQTNNSKLIIDEKATLHYVNKNIPTFAFELLNRTSGAQGWLFNHSYFTTHYLLAWPNAVNPNSIMNAEDFTYADIMLIERAALISLLAEKGLTEETLVEKVSFYLPRVTRESFKFELVPGINLFFTEWLSEKPVNIVVKKNLLDTIATIHRKFD